MCSFNIGYFFLPRPQLDIYALFTAEVDQGSSKGAAENTPLIHVPHDSSFRESCRASLDSVKGLDMCKDSKRIIFKYLQSATC